MHNRPTVFCTRKKTDYRNASTQLQCLAICVDGKSARWLRVQSLTKCTLQSCYGLCIHTMYSRGTVFYVGEESNNCYGVMWTVLWELLYLLMCFWNYKYSVSAFGTIVNEELLSAVKSHLHFRRFNIILTHNFNQSHFWKPLAIGVFWLSISFDTPKIPATKSNRY